MIEAIEYRCQEISLALAVPKMIESIVKGLNGDKVDNGGDDLTEEQLEARADVVKQWNAAMPVIEGL